MSLGRARGHSKVAGHGVATSNQSMLDISCKAAVHCCTTHICLYQHPSLFGTCRIAECIHASACRPQEQGSLPLGHSLKRPQCHRQLLIAVVPLLLLCAQGPSSSPARLLRRSSYWAVDFVDSSPMTMAWNPSVHMHSSSTASSPLSYACGDQAVALCSWHSILTQLLKLFVYTRYRFPPVSLTSDQYNGI